MRSLDDLRNAWQRLGRWGQVFALSILAYSLLSWAGVTPWLRTLLGLVSTVTGFVVAFKLIRHLIRQSIWRLRHRLMVAYAFVALVPILLIVALVGVATWTLSGQIAVYLVTSEFNRRLETLESAARNLLTAPISRRAEGLRNLGAFFEQTFPGLEILISDGGVRHFPDSSTLDLPPETWKEARGVVDLDGEFYAWVNVSAAQSRATLVVPLTRELLGSLVRDLGDISVVNFDSNTSSKKRSRKATARAATPEVARVPPPQSQLDFEVLWAAPVVVSEWRKPGSTFRSLFTVRSRISAVWRILLSQKSDWDNNWGIIIIIAVAILFLVVEIVALGIGVSLSRSITSAVHNLYEGTERIMEGDFAHRIRVRGRDQLAALGHSFNRMTENLESLLKVAKEKERYEAELEIAREIQKQLYPKTVPESPLKLTALYKPARMVSGDYYDYRRLNANEIALAIGDVAGKGISAALLMATIQSSFRSQLQSADGAPDLSTSKIVARLNEHLHANTPPEKFATFFVGVYDEPTHTLHYTNAGHLQPILVRNGQASRLSVDGMVIGAFPFARFGESEVRLERGDLLVCFTDGISEPENEYGEMFGEDQLTDLVLRNASKPEAELLKVIIEAVEKWTGSPELQDDMTLLVARRE